MAEFHETVGGRKFYDADVPRMVKALEGLQRAVEQLAKAARPVAPARPNIAVRENEAEARSIAKQIYADDDIEIEDDAEVDLVFSGREPDLQVTGAWVAAWVFVPFEANNEKGDE